jgi:hypothetical protein
MTIVITIIINLIYIFNSKCIFIYLVLFLFYFCFTLSLHGLRMNYELFMLYELHWIREKIIGIRRYVTMGEIERYK